MRILGIDPGLATIGYGIIDKTPTAMVAVDYGVITTSKLESTPTRLAMIDEALTQLIDKYKPDAVAVEELFFNTNITTAIKVAEARGVILLCAVKHSGNLYEYTPLQIKQAITGNGRADKQQIQYMVKAILNLKETPKPDDTADALACAITHAHMGTYNTRIIK